MKLKLEKINYGKKDLSPVMSEDTLSYHRDNLAAGYIKRFNNKEGDSSFNEAGAFLHNIFFPQLQPPSKGNSPHGESLDLINSKFKSFKLFKEEFLKKAMSIQGSGWVYLSKSGDIKIIKNHQIRKDIVLLVDWWEHAWALDYKQDKKSYLNNIWKIIDWDYVNNKITSTSKKKEAVMLKELVKLANHLDKKGFAKEADYLDNIIKKMSQDNGSASESEKFSEAMSKRDEFAERLKEATIGVFVPSKDPGFHLQTPILKTLEFAGGLGTNEDEIYSVFKEMKDLETTNYKFKIEDVAEVFMGMTGSERRSLYEVLKSELSEGEIEKVEELFSGSIERISKIK
jgi:Fe-Mn family superoxide dismutase